MNGEKRPNKDTNAKLIKKLKIPQFDTGADTEIEKTDKSK